MKKIIKKNRLKLVFKFIVSLIIMLVFTFFVHHSAKAMLLSNLKKFSFKKNIFIHKLLIKSGIIYKLNTALGYVSIITLPDIPLNVAIGNSSAFSEEVLGKQIFIKPLTYDRKTTTNLEILTKYGIINVLVRIKSPKDVTYNLDLANPGNNGFIKNYIAAMVQKENSLLEIKYREKYDLLNKERKELTKEKHKVMDLILTINKLKIGKSITKDGITLTTDFISHIGKLYYIRYQITNTKNSYFFIRNIYLYIEKGENFFNGYRPSSTEEIYLINKTPHNKKYMPYQIFKNVVIFKKPDLKNGGNLKFSVHILINGKLVKLHIGNILK